MLVPVNLKLRWFGIYAGFGLLFSIIITAVLTQTATRQLEQQVGASLANVAEQASYQLQQGMYERLRDMQTSAQLIEQPQNEAQFDRLRQLIAALYDSYEDYAWIGITNRAGEVLISSNGVLEGANVSQRPWFKEALQQPYFIGDVHGALLLESILNPDGYEPLRFVDISLPLKDPEGNVWGVFGSHLNWEWTATVESAAMRTLETLPGSDILLVNSEGKILLGPFGLEGEQLQTTLTDEVKTQGYGRQEWRDGQEYLLGYAKVGTSDEYRGPEWQIIVREPIEVALQPVLELRWKALAIGVAVALAFAGVGWVSAGRIARPFANLSTQLEQEVKERTEELRKTNEKLRKLATTDSLTGLLNRRALFRQAEKLKQRALRHGQKLAVVMIDLDHFKKVNDEYGHATGDEVLKNLAEKIQQHVREVDLAARSGGEEFTLVLDGSSEADGKKVVRRLADKFRSHEFSADGETFSVTLSAGVVQWNLDESFDKAVDQADDLLYEAKEKGRDQVVAASDTAD
ncbi:sensor domain-containing diguanylate cyclase [Pseudidiomarina insulisalsae]|uniref:diguanylate cyclase n=1 Tax=Pseudidiomarina insulisalsae TaxID=575789 RepID=A0A432YQP3_9GAMM|nr:sensor domain-containing diguanylate cyclase [Pseudidiomarina insulisalsae]RUO63695.1 hypothetical protein CWI71_01130 [Pseudidiomarina insulisalsae]